MRKISLEEDEFMERHGEYGATFFNESMLILLAIYCFGSQNLEAAMETVVDEECFTSSASKA